MTTAAPTAANPGEPPYDPDFVLAQPYPDRIRLICRQWAAQVAPNSPAIMAMYWAKYFTLFIGVWAFWCSFNAGYPGFFSPGEWVWTADAFRKAVLWAIFYEMCGWGCSSGPMTARFWPPFGGMLNWLWPGTTKLPYFPGAPIIGNIKRGVLDVGLYALSQALILRALMAPDVTPELMLPVVVLIPLLGILDKTLFLAARAEHYWVALTVLCFAYGQDLWVAGCKWVWCWIWFWAATSKVNHHFPSVIMVMMTQGPFFPGWLKKRLIRSYPDDLRPSGIAAFMAHFGTLSEYMIPVVLLSLTGQWPWIVLGLLFMTSFHGFIALNNPAGMPIEWNILMIWGGWFLFGFGPAPTLSPLEIAAIPALLAFLVFWLVLLPTYGNFVPRNVSFLLSMRYYAGNWAYSKWLFRGDSVEKLKKLRKPAGTMKEQLEKMLPDEKMVRGAMLGSLSNRMLHLQGRALHEALPRAVDHVDNYEMLEGELLAGMIVGWNFGEGHLHNEQLIAAVQEQCGFEEGELRVVIVESQPLFHPTMAWRVVDAVTGVLERGETHMGTARAWQPWPTEERAEAFLRGAPERAPQTG